MEPFVLVLLAHGVIGSIDVLVNHELVARVPALPGSAVEQWLHGARELIFAALFAGLAWFTWEGAAAYVIAALLLAELAVSTTDSVVEPGVRVLPFAERVLHVLLFVNFGALLALLLPRLAAWAELPTRLAPASYGAASWALSVLSLLALAWALRDASNAARRQKL